MLTKGIIKERILDSNLYRVRIPYFEQAGFKNVEYYDAIVAHEPALIDSYNVGDVVIIGFEDHEADKPVIIGKLLLNKEESRGYANVESLNVTTSARLPENTMIGDINVYEVLSALKRGTNNTNDAVESLINDGSDISITNVE